MAYEVKEDPNADLDYGFDWSAWLGAADTIAEARGLSRQKAG